MNWVKTFWTYSTLFLICLGEDGYYPSIKRLNDNLRGKEGKRRRKLEGNNKMEGNNKTKNCNIYLYIFLWQKSPTQSLNVLFFFLLSLFSDFVIKYLTGKLSIEAKQIEMITYINEGSYVR